MALRDYQIQYKADIYKAWDSGAQNVLGVAPTGSGKCLGKGTPVMRYDGRVTLVEDVCVGDLLMGPDSAPRRVESLSRGTEMLYRITPTKGAAYTVNESHILSLKLTPEETGENHRVENISVLTYLSQNKTYKHRAKGWRAAISWEETPTPLDPYFLGLWIGGGSARSAAITKPDPEVEECVRCMGIVYGLNVRREVNAAGRPTRHLVRPKGKSNPITDVLRSLGVLNNKHVPHCYKANSADVRSQLLAGLLDSDGSLSGNDYDFISISRSVSEDVAFLARSLGLAAYVSECIKRCQTGAEGTYHRVSISGDCDRLPLRIPRKKASPRGQKKNVLITGIKVAPIAVGEYFGFELSGPDRLFLLGDFTVTHNTVVLGNILKDKDQPSVAISHRQELVSQLALALNREQVPHGIIAPKTVISEIVKLEIEAHGKSYYQLRAPTRVAGVHTLAARDTIDPWFEQVKYAVIDEGHHVLRDNIFGKALLSFPNARGLMPTAHAIRADGCGLGRISDGLADTLVLGPSARTLINRGFLADYRLIAPPSDIDVSNVPLGSTGDFSAPKLRMAVHRSRTIVGDVVREYLRYAPGKRGLTFAVDIEAAEELVAAYRKANVPAEIITANTGISERSKIMRRFRQGSILQLVSVDVLGEGTDVPSVEIVSMARPTHSFQLYSQQFGRALRVSVLDSLYTNWDQYSDEQRLAYISASAKPKAIIIDHVGNWERHGLPDRPKAYSLERRERRSRRQEGEIPLKLCVTCFQPYEAIRPTCPYCGSTPVPRSRSSPEYVDGDLQELDAATLAQLRGEIERIDGVARIPEHVSPIVAGAIKKQHRLRQEAQQQLRNAIALWAGYWKMLGASDAESYRRFFYAFGKDVMSAQALNASDATEMTNAIQMEIQRINIEERK